jgi:hypothetical protein
MSIGPRWRVAGAWRTLEGHVRCCRILLVALLAPIGAATAQARPNEPLAFKPITSVPFDGTLADGWRKRATDDFAFTNDPSVPCSPPGIGRVRFRRGFPGGRGPAALSYEIPPGYKKLYVSFCLRLSRRWMGHPSGVNKVLHFWIADRNRVVFSATGIEQGPLRPQFRLQALHARDGARNLGPRPGITLRREVWHRIEIILTANTPDLPNGRIQWWVDNQLAGDVSNIPFVGPGWPNDWRRISWNPTWGGTKGVIPADQYMDMDDLYVSGGI